MTSVEVERAAEDPAFREVVEVVAEASGANCAAPERPWEGGTEAHLEAIGDANDFRVRRVILHERWWNEDCGALVGFLEGGESVALLPDRGGYRLQRGAAGEPSRVDAATAAGLRPYAFVILPMFPAGPVPIRAAVLHGLAGTRGDLAAMVGLAWVIAALTFVGPLLLGALFDRVIPAGRRTGVLQIGLALGVVALAVAGLGVARRVALIRARVRIGNALQGAVIGRVLGLPSTFFRQYGAGDLLDRSLGVHALRRALAGGTVAAVVNGLFALGGLAVLFWLDVSIALVALSLVTLSMTVTIVIGLTVYRMRLRVHEQGGRVESLVTEIIGGIAKLRVAAAEGRALSRWMDAFSTQRRLSVRARVLETTLGAFDATLPGLGLLALVMGAIGRGRAAPSTGEFLVFNAALATVLGAATSFARGLLTLADAAPSWRRLVPILDADTETVAGGALPGRLRGALSVRNVSFAYSPDQAQVLHEVSFDIGAGEYVALVGPSGCGKSTLLRVLLGFERPQSGAVSFDGKDLASLDLRAVRRQLGVVLQDGGLVPGSLMSNILHGESGKLDEAWEALRHVGLERDIAKMPMGLHTVVSEGTGGLSGGQVQRILIARALVSRPAILLFDEATSALDNESQQKVTYALDALGMTRIVVAHRLSTIEKADRILVMDGGRIVQQGTYDALLAEDGPFRRLATRQIA